MNLTARITAINIPSNDDTTSYDHVTVYRDGEEIDTLSVESSDDTAPYDQALRDAGYTDVTWEEGL